MDYKCMDCEVIFKVTFFCEPLKGYADTYYCPNCGKHNLIDNDN
jgi:DNA-directed RNA polymerase subunit RPC12/RpoP